MRHSWTAIAAAAITLCTSQPVLGQSRPSVGEILPNLFGIHDRARAEEPRRKSRATRRIQARRGSCRRRAVQPAASYAAVDLSGRILLERIDLHFDPSSGPSAVAARASGRCSPNAH